jgi:hypothetical protein
MSGNVLEQLENAEFKWKGLKKKMLNRREQLTSLQQAEVSMRLSVLQELALCATILICASQVPATPEKFRVLIVWPAVL